MPGAAFEFLGAEHTATELVLFAVGWSAGWFLLARPRTLPPGGGRERPAVAVVVPARDEATSLPHLLPPLLAQRRTGDEIVVVDDRSADGTARVAQAFGVDVVPAPDPPRGWLGKPHACHLGATATTAPVLVFLDADVVPGPTLLDDVASAVTAQPDTVVSAQPWHAMETVGEQPSILCNVAALMGCGAFTAIGDRGAATVAFGPVLAVGRATYERVGGHAAPEVRDRHVEDVALARAVGRSALYVGSPATTRFRMYPDGFGALLRGWSRSFASGAVASRPWLVVLTTAWIASLAGGWIAAPVVYPLSALQVWVLGRRAGRIDPAAALCYPVLVAAFLVIAGRSAVVLALRRPVSWRGRRLTTR